MFSYKLLKCCTVDVTSLIELSYVFIKPCFPGCLVTLYWKHDVCSISICY